MQDEIGPEFDWDRQLQGIILSAYYFGYLVTQIPTGFYLNPRFGGKWVMFVGMSSFSLLTFLSPPAARVSPYLLIIVQVGKGLVGVSMCHYNSISLFIAFSEILC